MTARSRVRRYIATHGVGYQSRTQWEIAKELRRIEQSKRGQVVRKPPQPGGSDPTS